MEELIRQVAEYYGITPESLRDNYFEKRTILIRSTLCDFLHNELHISNCELSRYFHKDRNTIVKQTRQSEFEREQFQKYMYADRSNLYEIIKFINKKSRPETEAALTFNNTLVKKTA